MPRGRMMSDSSELQLFQILLKAMGARHYLEIGVYTGVSALAAALALPPDGCVIGLEINEENVKVGRPFWKEVLWKAKVCNPALDDPITESLRRLNLKLASDDRVEISMLTLSDGVTFALKK
ncbi:hypothetical protein HPB49_015718 [Dermacentor silvarum]|uniref:Uncharacterized protein n=1 Tax=Dermacentor silvarum TaxID=543639 RepID=A0ACB8CYB8_DERSI|nr:hypothetical protein HPB49_015718 [Dermacentor silvarum]